MQQTRWLFCLAVLLSVVLTLPAVVTAGGSPAVLGIGAALVLACSSVLRYRGRVPSWLLDLLDAAGVLAFAAACPQPAVALSFGFSVSWFRALYGSDRRVGAYAVGVAAAMALSVPAWSLVAGHDGTTAAAPVLGALPLLLLTVGVARYLALAMFAREQAQSRDAALARLGTELLGVTDRDKIVEQAWRTAGSLCRTTPGLRVLVVADRPGGPLQVKGHAGHWRRAPGTVPVTVLPGRTTGTGSTVVASSWVLDESVGVVCAWQCIDLPGPSQETMLLGAPGSVSPDTVVAFRSMTNQIALAMRTSDAHRDLEQQAHTDGLTGLANRTSFTGALERSLARNPVAGVAVLFLDLDDFKTVNDGLGHAAGDELLRQVAARLGGAVGPSDLCARLGGDEFAVLLTSTADAEVLALAKHLVGLVATPVVLGGRHAAVGASIGVAFADGASSAGDIVQQADVAMYSAKANGKNQVKVFGPGLLQPGVRAELDAELAVAAAAGQLEVHYQSILAASDDRCTAVEALVRWQHPTRGLLAPADFMPDAERTGAVVGIGAAVLREACTFVAALDAAGGDDIAVHVNVSAAQLGHPGFLDAVQDCVQRYALAPRRLVLEITESMVLDAPAVLNTLDTLVGLGVSLAVDDFGTGYSALTTLRTMPLEIVKIDRSFVAGLPTDTTDLTVVEAVVQMAHRLGLRTIAEGVERPEQQKFLREAGVDAIQGFLHRRPAPAEEVLAWLANRGRTSPAAARGPVGPPVLTLAQRQG